MKTTALRFLMLAALLLTACGGSAPAGQDQQLMYAQQTLDALNAGVSENQPLATTVPQTNTNQPAATALPQTNITQPSATPVPQANNNAAPAGDVNSANTAGASSAFAGAAGQWESLDSDLSYQTLTIAANADGSYAFKYTDQGASTCGFDANHKPVNAMTFSGSGRVKNNVLSAAQVEGVCENTARSVAADLQFTYQADSNTILDGSGIVWKQSSGTGGSMQSEPAGRRINLFDATGRVIDFPANQAFHIEHGWSYDAGNSAQNVFATSNFALLYDKQALPLDTLQVVPDDSGNAGQINWVYNFPNGLTGAHSFTGIWTGPCALAQPDAACDDPTAMVEAERVEIRINFTP